MAESQKALELRDSMRPWMRGLVGLLALFLFVSSVTMIGTGLKTIADDKVGEEFLHWLFGLVDDPITGLFIGLLITSLVQSSSFTTSMVVSFVAAGQVTLTDAIPIIMGANIGTSITGLLVSMGHLRRRDEFRRSLGAASCHDFFNLLSVLMLLPLEVKFKIISRPMVALAELLQRAGLTSSAGHQDGPIKICLSAIGKLFKWLLKDVMHLGKIPSGAIIAICAMVLLFVALWLLVKMLRGILQGRLSNVFSKTLFRNPATAFVVGIVMTASVQSSSVTISMIVPLVGADVLNLAQVFPYMLGANIGTTVTAILAALSLGSPAAIACACGHLLFNVYGTGVFWPLKVIPIAMATTFGDIAAHRRLLAIVYILGMFFLLPIVVLLIMKGTGHL